MAETVQERLRDEDAWLVVKRKLYYAPNDCGYTGIRDLAGRYTEAEAKARTSVDGGVTMVKLTDAPEFTKACFEDLAIAHMRKKYGDELTTLRAQRDQLLEVVSLIGDFLSCEGHWEQPDDAKVIVKCGATTYYGWVLGDLRKARDVSRDVRSAIEALKGK